MKWAELDNKETIINLLFFKVKTEQRMPLKGNPEGCGLCSNEREDRNGLCLN